MIVNSQRTIYGLEYQANKLVGLPYTPRINTTLNEKFGVLPNEAAGSDIDHSVKYIGLGTGGELVANSVNGYSRTQHSPLDAALFEHVPFVIRPVTNDLSAAEQTKYRLKVRKTIHNVDYYQYFLRVINSSDITTGVYRVTANAAGSASLSLLTTDTTAQLNPAVAPVVSNNKSYITKMVKLKFNLTPADLTEINSAIDIMYQSNAVKPITEICVCGGLNKTVNGVIEAIQTQVYFHVGVNIDTRSTFDAITGYTRAIELGGSSPLYGV